MLKYNKLLNNQTLNFMESKNIITATVIKSDANNAWLEVHRASGCGGCSQSTHCGISNLAEFFTKKSSQIKVPNNLSVQKNDKVILAYSDKTLVKYAFVAYLFPILCLFIFAGFGVFFAQKIGSSPDLLSVIFAGFGLIFSGFYLKYYRIDAIRIEKKLLT